jgi:hypothetical protein
MNKLLIAACALLALPGAAFAQPGGSHGGGSSHGGGGGHGAPSSRGGFSAAGGGFRGGAGFRGGVGGIGSRAFAAGPVGRFGARDVAAWRGGFWWHGYRGSRFGWWWFTDGFWYWYDAPLYPYPDYVGDYYVPSQAYAPPGQVWYYCYNPAGYYPYVPACPSGWRVVPATPGPDDE